MDIGPKIKELLGLRAIGAKARRQERLLDFIGVGAQKTGTTSLYGLLALHPQIELFRRKELHYFRRDKHFGSDHRPLAGNYDELHRHFYFDRQITGEITPIYLYWRHTLDRIKKYKLDDWNLIVKQMRGYGLKVSNDEADMIAAYLKSRKPF